MKVAGIRREFQVKRLVRASEELRRMSVRSVLVKGLSISPIIFVGAVCAQSRFYQDPFQQVFNTPSQESAISAYIEPVKLARESFASSKSAATTRSVAMVWLEGNANRTLKPLLPCSPDDTLRSPIKGQILGACDSIVERLTVLANDECEGKKFTQAAQDYVLALRTCEILKYSDSVSLSVQASRERGLLKLMNIASVAMPVSDLGKLRGELVTLKNQQVPMDDIYRTIKGLYVREVERSDSNEVASFSPESVMEVGFVADPMTERTAVQKVMKRKGRAQASALLVDFNMAYKSELRFIEQLDNQIKKLPNRTPGVST
jgi:hypothetical protein